MAFKMKQPPGRPRQNHERLLVVDLDEHDGSTLSTLVNIYGEDATLGFTYHYEDTTANLSVKNPETNEEFAERYAVYDAKLAEYNAWYEENKGEIEQYLANKAAKEKQKLEKERERLQKQLSAVEKKAARL